MAYYGWFFGGMNDDDSQADQSGTYALHTLSEDETIARLATGIKRFQLPDEFNHIRLYQDIVKSGKCAYVARAAFQLSEVFTNRRQYPKAAEYLSAQLKPSPERHL